MESPGGGCATADVEVGPDGRPVRVRVAVMCGEPLDEIVLRSYCIGAAHMAVSWVCSEGIALDQAGNPQDLTIRSFGVLRAVDTPVIEVVIEPATGPAVNGSDAVFAAVSAATWIAQGLPPEWPTMRGKFT
jgi:xanthine dehydrogenase small subunit